MNGLWQRLFPTPPPLVVAILPEDASPDWNEFHRDQLRAFLKSPTGIAIQARWQALEQANMSVREARPEAMANGALIAVGFAQARHWFLSLSSPSRTIKQEENTEQPDQQGNQTLLDRYSP